MQRRTLIAAALAAGAVAATLPGAVNAQARNVTINVLTAGDQNMVDYITEFLGPQFEKANPGVKVKHTHFPYAQYRTKTAAAVPAGNHGVGDALCLDHAVRHQHGALAGALQHFASGGLLDDLADRCHAVKASLTCAGRKRGPR